MIRDAVPDVPIVLQSSRTEFRERAHAEGFSFLRKRSPTLLRDLRRFLTEQFGFGDFVFRLPDWQRSGTRQRLERARNARCRKFPRRASLITRRATIFRAG